MPAQSCRQHALSSMRSMEDGQRCGGSGQLAARPPAWGSRGECRLRTDGGPRECRPRRSQDVRKLGTLLTRTLQEGGRGHPWIVLFCFVVLFSNFARD
jgi:hypothetical protein